MGCAAAGCSEWDYTTRIEAIKPTGKWDSTKKQWPSFKVDGKTVDSIQLSHDPTYETFYDEQNNNTDSTKRDSLTIIRYGKKVQPKKPTDTLYAWPAGYYNKTYDQSGNVTDSHLVRPDTTLQKQDQTYYERYEIHRKLELASAITPYGGYMKNGQKGYDNDWQRTFLFDVTDFQKYLSDSVKIRVYYDGWSSGFSANLDFHFVEGEPAREVASIKKLYQGQFNYNDTKDFEQNKMPSVDVDLPQNYDQARILVIGSGHGFDNDKNCAEFCKKNYFLKVNGSREASKLLWRSDCGMNPVYPQGGTWLLDRSNWCPGSKVKTYSHEIGGKLKAGTNTLNLDMEKINWSGEQTPSYHFAVHLITYIKANHNLDVSLEAITAPSARDAFARINPIAMQPRVKVKNTGTKPVNSIRFTYHSQYAPENQFKWEGTIPPYKTRAIELPDKVKQWRKGDTVFRVKIEKVNGKADENEENNQRVSHFNPPPVLPNEFKVWLNTNRQGNQTRLTIRDAEGKTWYERKNLDDNARYRDTVSLPEGYGEYKLVLSDDAPNVSSPQDENGLYYSFFRQFGSGSLTLRSLENRFKVVKEFEPDFGTKIVYHFTTKEGFWGSTKGQQTLSGLQVYPNPSNGRVRLQYPDAKAEVIKDLQVVNTMGRMVHETNGPLKTGNALRLSHLPSGVYLVKGQIQGKHFSRRIILY